MFVKKHASCIICDFVSVDLYTCVLLNWSKGACQVLFGGFCNFFFLGGGHAKIIRIHRGVRPNDYSITLLYMGAGLSGLPKMIV